MGRRVGALAVEFGLDPNSKFMWYQIVRRAPERFEELRAPNRRLIHDMAIDTDTPQGRLFFSMVGAFAEFERALIAERVKDGLAYAKAHGTKSGRPIGRPRLNRDFVAICDALRERMGEPGAISHVAREFQVSRAWVYKCVQVYVDGHIPEDEYGRQKKRLEEKLRSLVVPDADVALQAGKLLEDLPRLWKIADLTERRRILLTMLDAVYVDTVEEKRIVAIRPRPAFRPLMEITTTRRGSGIVLVSEQDVRKASQPPPGGHEADGASCLWWRRGRVELHRKHGIEVLLAA